MLAATIFSRRPTLRWLALFVSRVAGQAGHATALPRCLGASAEIGFGVNGCARVPTLLQILAVIAQSFVKYRLILALFVYTVRTVIAAECGGRTQERTRTNFMPHKNKALDQQESQQLAPEAYVPAGREPMTGAQASYLKMLAEEVREPSAFEQGLSEREASRRIDALMERLRLGDLPPHTD
jgi:hypothetical protein